jgi:hypothetical protein
VLPVRWGAHCLGAYNPDAVGNATLTACGVVQLLYGIGVLLILAKDGAEFSRPRPTNGVGSRTDG